MRFYSLVPVYLGTLLLACASDPASQGAGGQPGKLSDAGSALTADAGAQGGLAGGPGAAGGTAAGGTAGGGVVNPSGPNTPCESFVADGNPAIPDMLIVLDRSGSMNPDNNDDNTDRWGGSRTALIEVTEMFDDQVRFGLMTFPGVAPGGGDDDDDNECAPGNLDVPIAINAGPTIATTLQGMDADGRTPTAAALQAALPIVSVKAGPDEVAPAKYVLLVTDGDPNCSGGGRGGGGGGGRDDAARMQTVQAIEALTMAGVKTFVVGYQTAGTDFAQQLDTMAAAGGTGATAHISVDSGAGLRDTISQLTSKLVSCAYQLKAAVADPSKVLVTVSGRPRNLNSEQDGWRLESDRRTVTLLGSACQDVQGGAVFSVQVTCDSVPIF
jgi:hypothetical protein